MKIHQENISEGKWAHQIIKALEIAYMKQIGGQ